MKPLSITKTDPPALRVFAISRPTLELFGTLKDTSKQELATALLGHPLPKDGFELFPVKDLEGVGLPGYLIEGQGIPDAQITPDRSRLNALEGYVLILLPGTFRGQDVTLPGSPELTLIGTYEEPRADMSAAPIDSAAAEPYSGVPSARPVIPPRGKAGSALTLAALFVAVLLLIWWLIA